MTQFGYSAIYDKFEENSIVKLNNFMIGIEPKGVFWFECNSTNYYLISNSTSLVNNVSETEKLIGDILCHSVSELAHLDIKNKKLITFKCIIKNSIKNIFNGKTRINATAIDTNKNYSISVVVWDISTDIDSGFEYTFNNVLIDPTNGFTIGKLFTLLFRISKKFFNFFFNFINNCGR